MTSEEASALILATADKVRAAGPGSPRLARDPVNLPAIRNWTDAIGDSNPVYTDADFAARSVHGGLVAPPAMVQVWTMPGLQPAASDDGMDPLGQMMRVLDEAGYPAVVATNCAQTYHRYLRHGEVLSVQAELADVTGPKRTALGEGWFVTTRNTWYSGDKPVAEMDWRVLKYKPAAAAKDGRDNAAAGQEAALGPAGAREDPPTQSQTPPLGSGGARQDPPTQAFGPAMRPPVSPDTAFFWAGTLAGELRIQRCGVCGALRHPPGPACLSCGATDSQGYVVAAGTGTVYSYVVHHHPPVPGKRLPMVIALVELTEGVRVMAELIGVEPDQVQIGMAVRTTYLRIDDDLVLPGWRRDERSVPDALPELAIKVTPTVVVATAIATRDFYPVHHDHDMAVRSGSKDIFLNILTTTGLVQRYVTDWAGPEAVVRAVSIRLGVPCYAGDTLTFAGRVSSEPSGEQVISVTGTCSLGDHVTGTVRLAGRASAGGTS